MDIMTEKEKGLISLMERIESLEFRASILSLYVQENGPVSEECGQKVRELLEGQKA